MKITRYFNLFFLAAALCLAGCSKTGPAGPQGPKGEQGKQGEQGPQGIPGADGSTIYSDNGAPVADIGKTGDYYLDKSTGDLYGPKTDNGWGDPVSLKGSKGEKGPKGDKGDSGPQGDKGDKGATGATGPQGAKGEKGDPGQDGKDGSQILSGTSTPSASAGNVGDYYWNTTTFTLYGPKTASGWGSGIGLRGPQGPKGEKGDKGDPGTANVITSGWLGIDDINNWVQMGTSHANFNVFSEPEDLRLMVDYYNPFHIDAKNAGGAILVYVRIPFNQTIRLCPFGYKVPAIATPPPYPLTIKFRFVIQKSGAGYLLYRVVALRKSVSVTSRFWSSVIYGGFSWKIVIIPPSHARKSTPPPDPKNYKATCKYYGIPE